MNIRPGNIQASKSKAEATIRWADGHISVYPFWLLRAACPCAQCRGGHENMGAEPDPHVFDLRVADSPATHLAGIRPTGSYGVTIVWEDGHDYGIYNWQYLRALCPCAQCRPPLKAD